MRSRLAFKIACANPFTAFIAEGYGLHCVHQTAPYTRGLQPLRDHRLTFIGCTPSPDLASSRAPLCYGGRVQPNRLERQSS